MMRNFLMKTYYRRVVDNIVNNFIVCSSSRKSYHQVVPIDKIVRLEDTGLQPRILKYFRECVNYDVQFGNNLVARNPIDNWEKLSTLNINQISEMILSLAEPTFKRKYFKIYLRRLDKECCLRLENLTNCEVFNLLHDFMNAIPHMVTQLSFYTKVINKMSFLIEHCSKIELLQLCFYVALQKKSPESQTILKDCLNKFNGTLLNNFNINDLIILCNSSYKTSTKIQHRKILDKILNTIYNNLNILTDTTSFITLVKSLRQNKYQNEELLATISNAIFFNKTIEYYSFTANSHILSLYADALHYDENLFSLLVKKCVTQLQDNITNKVLVKNEYFSKQIRVKDIARFLWSVSYLSYDDLDYDNVISNDIIPFLQSYIMLGELEKNIEYFIDSLLSIWIIGYKPDSKFIASILTRNTVSLIYGKQKRRHTARLNLLLNSLQWENKELIPSSIGVNNNKIAPWNKNSQMRNRPLLKVLYNSLCHISPKININKFELTSPVPHLNIIGITGHDKENNPCLYVELIDDLTKVRNRESIPHGLMKLKIRLLRKFRKNILIVDKDDIEYLSQSELSKYLERKIRLLNVSI